MSTSLDYINFLYKLKTMKTNIFHVISFRKNDINGMSLDELLNKKMPIPTNVFKVEKIIVNDIQHNKYVNYKSNEHHWTTAYCWKNVIPVICKNFSIDINENEFTFIPYIWNTSDFSYHQQKKTSQFKVTDFETHISRSGNQEILRNINDSPRLKLSLYHSLFRLSHTSGEIHNLTTKSNRILVVNTDSMSVPIIPILAYYFKKIIIIDNRLKKNFNYAKMIIDKNPTDYLCLLTEMNFLINNKQWNNIK